MKKPLYILSALIAAVIVLVYLTNRKAKELPVSEMPDAVSQPQKEVKMSPNVPIKVPRPTPPMETGESTNELINALTATNLEQWKAISGLKKLGGFTFDQHWLMERPGRTNGLPIILSFGDKTIQYNAVLISVNAKNENGQVEEVEMQTSNMNIDETRELGLQLCNMFGVNSTDFIAWCDKVGNHWLDMPLYGSQDIHDPDSNTVFAFQTIRGFNDEKPWLINFMIIPNP